MTVLADNTTVGGTPDASIIYTLAVTDVKNEGSALPTVYVPEVAPWSSGSSAVKADRFEVTDGSAAALDITAWKFDDSSGVFARAVTFNGVTPIVPGESVILLESADPAAAAKSFVDTRFGVTGPVGLQIGTYTGEGVALSTGGDAVNLYNAAGVSRTSVTFGAAPAAAPFATFNNAAAVTSGDIKALSAAGTNGASVAAAAASEIGSPGGVGRFFISEIAPGAVVTNNGEKIGIVGVSFLDLLTKTSPNGTRPRDDGNDGTSDLQEVAAHVPAGIDPSRATLADGLSRLQSQIAVKADLSPRQLLVELHVRGIEISFFALWHIVRRAGPRFKKKSLHASEQDRPDFSRRRTLWRSWLRWVIARRRQLFIDEIWVKTKMTINGEQTRWHAGSPGAMSRPHSSRCL